jgi:hypothetical protein
LLLAILKAQEEEGKRIGGWPWNLKRTGRPPAADLPIKPAGSIGWGNTSAGKMENKGLLFIPDVSGFDLPFLPAKPALRPVQSKQVHGRLSFPTHVQSGQHRPPPGGGPGVGLTGNDRSVSLHYDQKHFGNNPKKYKSYPGDKLYAARQSILVPGAFGKRGELPA